METHEGAQNWAWRDFLLVGQSVTKPGKDGAANSARDFSVGFPLAPKSLNPIGTGIWYDQSLCSMGREWVVV